MKIEKLFITPEVAKEFLLKNTSNRPVKKSRVLQYSKDIKNDKWIEDTGETIKICKDGTILDGQHRLMAIVSANKPAYFHVVTDLNPEIFKVIDTGIKRTGTDVFSISGVKNSNKIPGIINRFIYIQSGSKGDHKMGPNTAITNSEVIELYNTRPRIWDGIAENAIRWYRTFNHVLSCSVIGGWYAHFYGIDTEQSFSFFEQLCTGENISNPTINVLRNLLIKDKLSQNKMQKSKQSTLILKTWNCFRKGTILQVLKYDASTEDKLIAI